MKPHVLLGLSGVGGIFNEEVSSITVRSYHLTALLEADGVSSISFLGFTIFSPINPHTRVLSVAASSPFKFSEGGL